LVGWLVGWLVGRLCRVTDTAEIYATKPNDPMTRQSLDASFLSKTAEEWEKLLLEAGVPATAVVRAEDSTAKVEQLTGDVATVDVTIQPKKKRSSEEEEPNGEGEEQKEATAETLALLRSPLSLGVPSATPGSDLGADNVAFGLEELKDDEDEDEDEDEDGFAK
jgi:hypothetical protein